MVAVLTETEFMPLEEAMRPLTQIQGLMLLPFTEVFSL